MKNFLRNNKGITMISLVVTIFILAFVVGTVVYYSRSIAETARFENVKANMILIQAQAKIISEKYNYDSGSIEILGQPDESGFYILSSEDLEKMGMDDLVKEMQKSNDNANYLVRYAIGDYRNQEIDVKYNKGIIYENTVYYLLSDIQAEGL